MSGEIKSLIVKIAERCNLNCTYCYMYNHEDKAYLTKPPIMSDEVFDRMLDRVSDYCDAAPGRTMALTFHGGEPTLVGTKRFERLVHRARGRLGGRLRSLGVQTNATLIDQRWIDLFVALDIRPGVSLDGPAHIQDAARIDHFGRGSYARSARGLLQLIEAGLEPGVLCVVNPAHSGLETYAHFRKLGISRINYLLPDVSHDNKATCYPSASSVPVADYLLPVFDAWFDENDPSIVVQPFRSLLALMMGGRSAGDDFGDTQMNYLIIETDGEIELLDALKVCAQDITRDQWRVQDHGFEEVLSRPGPFRRMIMEHVPLCAECRACPNMNICGGGYLPHRYARANGFDNPSVWCADIKRLLDHIRTRADVEAFLAARDVARPVTASVALSPA